MKVFINCRWITQNKTGTHRYAEEITKRLTDLDEVFLCVPRASKVPDWMPLSKVVRLPGSGFIFDQVVVPLRTIGNLALYLSGPVAILKRLQIAVFYDLGFERFPKHYSRLFRLWYRLMYFIGIRSAKHLVTISKFAASEFKELYALDESKMTIIHCAADHLKGIKPKRPNEIPQSVGNFVLFVGALNDRKNQREYILDLLSSGWVVVHAGAISSKKIFGQQATLQETKGRYVPISRVTDEELKWLYQNATAFVFPSLYEGFGIPPLEALVCGARVFVSSIPVHRELFSGLVTFINLESKKPFILDQPPAVARRQYAKGLKAYYSWDKSALKFKDLINAVDVKK